jgi:hypothetical protein
MAQSIKCRGVGCTFESEIDAGKGLDRLFGKIVWGLHCPNCSKQGLGYKGIGSEYIFSCRNCDTQWERVPCPECGTSIAGSHTAGGCYVATCVYGSYDCPEVWTLRRFRDNTLAKSIIGRRFIKMYYFISPKMIKLFGQKAWFRNLWKPILNKFVHLLKLSGFNDKPYSDDIEGMEYDENI